MEDTLNNSNDLFLTFRREMEDMSKKTKRLERDNENFKRKHERMNANVVKMADERTKLLNDAEAAKKRETKLSNIIKQMQQQGRGIPPGLAGTVENGYVEGESAGDAQADDSEYDDEDDYDDEAEEGEEGELSEDGEDGEDYDEETEDELQVKADQDNTNKA